MVRDTLLGFPSHSLPYRYRKSCHFIDSLRLSHKRWLSPIINHVIARPVRKLVVAIRIPVPSAPLPKGGWHGEAVTGGFFPRTAPSCNAFVGAGVPDGPFCRTSCYASVGADAHIGPPYRTINNASVGADASVRPLRLTARFYNRSGPWPYRSAYTPPQIPRR